jgi:hypothetical protein
MHWLLLVLLLAPPCLTIDGAKTVTSKVRFFNFFNSQLTITVYDQSDGANITFSLAVNQSTSNMTLIAHQIDESTYLADGIAKSDTDLSVQLKLEYNFIQVNGSDLVVIYPSESNYSKMGFIKQRIIDTLNIDTKSPYDKNYMFQYAPLPSKDDLIYTFYLKSDNCHRCEYQKLDGDYTKYFTDNSIGKKTLKIVSSEPDKTSPFVVEIDGLEFKSRGVYQVIYSIPTQTHIVVPIVEPENDTVPLLIFGAFVLCAIISRWIYSRYTDKIEADEYYSVKKNIRNPSNTTEYIVEERIVEADILRGFFIILFIIVNCGGGGYEIMNESVWDGMQIGDIPELGIAWVSGFCIPTMIKYKSKIFKSRRSFVKFVLVKCCILIGAGFSYNGNYDLTKFIYTGLFQRLGLALAINTLLVLYIPFIKHETERAQPQLKRLAIRSLIILILPIVNVVLTLNMHVPNCPTGYLRPGGVELNGKYMDCTGGAHRYVDLQIFGKDRLRTNPSCKNIYHCADFDKYGFLGTLNFVFGVYLGVLIGEGFIKYKDHRRRMIYTVSHCLVYLLLMILSIIFMDEYFIIPLNRNLYSLSFVICGTLIVEVLFILLTYMRSWLGYCGWPFIQVGLNGLAILFMQEVCKDILPFGFLNNGEKKKLVICAIMNVTIWTVFGLALHKYRFYIKF